MFKKTLAWLLTLALFICSMPLSVFAAEDPVSVDISNATVMGDFDFTDATGNEKGTGCTWNYETKTLTLSGAAITSAVVLPADSTIVVTEGTENSVTVESGNAIEGKGTLAVSGKGKLSVKSGDSNAIAAPSVSITDTVVDLYGYLYAIQAKTTSGDADSVVTLTNVSGKIVGYGYGGINAHSETANVTVKLTGCHDLEMYNEVTNDSTSVNFNFAGIRAYTRGSGKDVLVELNDCENVSISNSTMAILAANNANAANAEAAEVKVLIKDSTGIKLTGNTSCYSAVFVNNYGVENDDSANLKIEDSTVEVNAPNATALMTSTKSAPSEVDINGSDLTITAGLTGIRTIASSADYAETNVTGSKLTFTQKPSANCVDESCGSVVADEEYADDASTVTVLKKTIRVPEDYDTLKDAITEANATDGGAIVVLNKDVTLGEKLTISGDVTISGGYTITRADNYTGTLFTVNAGATLTLDGGLTIDGGNEWTYIEVDGEKKFIHEAENYVERTGYDTLDEFVTAEPNAPVATADTIAVSGALVLNKVTLQNNWGKDGANMIDLAQNGELTMGADAVITHNVTNGQGPAVKMNKNSRFTMNGGKISWNAGRHHGGGAVSNHGGYFTMNDGEISHNFSVDGMGVALFIYDTRNHSEIAQPNFKMEGGKIEYNVCFPGTSANANGTAIYARNGIMEMNGGSINNNYGRNFAGVGVGYVALTINGGSIVNNQNVRGNTDETEHDLTGIDSTKITGGTFTQDVSAWLAPNTGLVYDEATGTYGVTDHVYNLWFRDPTTGEQVDGVGPLKGNDPASLIATGKLFYADYYEMELEVLSNAKVDKTVVIDYPMTINLNGKTISATSALEATPVFRILSNVTVTGNGKVDGRGGTSCYAFIVGKGEEAGNLTIENGTFYGDTTVASVTKGALTVNGGNFEATEYDGAHEFTLNCIDANYKNDTAKIVVNGGTFYKFNPANNAAEGTGTSFVTSEYLAEADGDYYSVRVNKDALNPIVTITFKDGNNETTLKYPSERFDSIQKLIGTNDFADFVLGATQNELLAYIADGRASDIVITLHDDVALDAPINFYNKYFQIPVEYDITLDGNGHTITWADGYNGTLFNVESGVDLTVKNLTIDGDNAFTFYDDTTTVENGQNWYTRFVNVGEEDKAINANVIVNAGALTLDGVTIKNVTIASDGANGKTENTETGYILKYNDDLALIKSNGGKVNMNGSTISGNAGMVLNAVNAVTTIKDSKINGNMGCGNKGGIIIANGGKMNIYSGSSISNNKAMARSATVLGVINGAEVTFNATMDNNKHIGVGSNTAGSIVCLEGASQFVMNGGSISNNVGGRAGAIASRWVGGNYGQHEETSIVLNAGKISGNTASNDSWNGASIFLRSPATIGEGMEVEGTIAVNAAPGELDITGGTFTNFNLVVNNDLPAEITGGTFDTDPSEWLAEGYVAPKQADGTYSVEVAEAVAQVGDKIYYSLQEAINACKNGETVKLIADITYGADDIVNAIGGATGFGQYPNPAIIYVGGTAGATAAENQPSDVNVVIDLNGHTITNDADAYLFLLMDNCKVTFTDSDREGKGAVITTKDAPVIWVVGTETLVTIESGKYVTASASGLIHTTHGGDLVIEGGDFSTTADDASLLILLNTKDRQNSKYFISGKATVTIKGGTFKGFNPEKVMDDSKSPYAEVNGCADGYEAKDNGDGTYGVQQIMVAQIGETKYPSLQEAINDAKDDDVIKLLENIDVADYQPAAWNGYNVYALVEGKSITIDMNGKSISGEYTVNKWLYAVFMTNNNGHLTLKGNGTVDITDGTTEANGRIFTLIANFTSDSSIIIENGAYKVDRVYQSMILDAGAVDGAIHVKGGTFTLGNLDDENGPWIFNVEGRGDHYVYITGGTFNADINRQKWSNEVVVSEECYVTTDGTYWTVNKGAVAYVNTGMLTGSYPVRKNVGYATLAEAIKAAVDYTDGPVTLLKNAVLTEDLIISADYIVINKGAYTITGENHLILKAGTYDWDVNGLCAEGYMATEASGLWTVAACSADDSADAYIKWVKAQLLAGNDVTLSRDIVVDGSYIESIPHAVNGNGYYFNPAIFTVVGDKDAVFDLNGHTITYNGHADAAYTAEYKADYYNGVVNSCTIAHGLFFANGGADLTVKDSSADKTGTVMVYGLASGAYVAGTGSSLTIQGGTWKNEGCKTCGGTNIFLYPLQGGELYIEDGYFNQALDSEGESYLIVEHGGEYANAVIDYSKTKVEITGGTFVGMNPAEIKKFNQTADNKLDMTGTTNGCAEDYVAVDNGDGTYGVIPRPLAHVEVEIMPGFWGKTFITTENWGDLIAALGENTNLPVKVTLLGDIDLSDEVLTIAGTAAKTIDLNGYKLTGTFTESTTAFVSVTGGCELTLLDSSDAKTGGIHAVNTNGNLDNLIRVETDGKLVIESGNYTQDASTNGSGMIDSRGKEIITVNGGNFRLENIGTASNGSPWLFNTKGQNSGNYIVVNGGTFNTDILHQYYIFEVEAPNTRALKKNGDDTYTMVDAVAWVVENQYSGYYKEIGYTTFAEAVAAADEGETVTLLTDVEVDGAIDATGIEIVQNGHKIILTATGATLTTTADLTVESGVDGYEVVHENGVYQLVKAEVAAIGETKYESLQDAIDAANTGDEIVLLENIDVADVEMQKLAGSYDTYFLVEGKSITVDLNEKTISGAYTGSLLVGVFSTDKNGELTLTGNGTVDVTATGTVYALIANYNPGCSITIENGTYKLDKAHDSLVFHGGNEDAAVTVNGGTFTLGNVGKGENGKPWIFNVLGAGDHHVLVTGGTFNADINRQHWSNEAVVSEKCYVVNNGDGTWTVKEGAVAYVATGMTTGPYYAPKDVGYATIEEAFEAAVNADDKSITLLQNVALTKDVEISIKVLELVANGFELDCNGHKIILTAAEATLTAPEDLTVTTNVAGMKVVYENGIHKLVKAEVVKNATTGVTYATLQDAIDAATAGDTIVFLKDITEDVTVGKSITIDGAGKTYTGNISVSGSTTAVTVKNVNFVDGAGYAITTNRIKSITVENCTVTNYGSGFLYANKSTPTVIVKNVTVDGGNYGFHWAYGTTATLENVTMTNVTYGLHIQNYAGKTINVKNSTISSISIWERSGYSGVQTFNFEGANTVGALDDSQYAKYVLNAADATLTAPADADVTTSVENSLVKYVDGTYKVIAATAKNGTTGKLYESLQAAINEAEDGDKIIVLANIDLAKTELQVLDGSYDTYFLVEGKSITVDLNEKTISGAYTGTRMLVGVFSTDNNGHLTLTGNGTVDVTATKTVYALIANYEDGCSITIEDGTYKLDMAHDSLVYSGCTVTGNEGVTVNDGTFTLGNVGKGENGKPWIFNVLGGNERCVVVSGGTFNANVANQFWIYEVQLASGCIILDNDDGTWTVKKNFMTGANMNLGNSLDMNFFMDPFVLADNLGDAFAMVEGWEVRITLFQADGEERTQVYKNVTNVEEWWYNSGVKKMYVIYADIAAKEMTDRIRVQIFDADGKIVSGEWNDSVYNYANRIMESTAKELADETITDEAKAKAKKRMTLMVDMLNYGAAAQLQFGYHLDAMASDILLEYAEYATTGYDVCDGKMETDPKNSPLYSNLYIGVSLGLVSDLKMGFAFDQEIVEMVNEQGYTIKVTHLDYHGKKHEEKYGKGYEFGSIGEYAIIYYDEILVGDANQLITVEVLDVEGRAVLTITDSVCYYVQRMSKTELPCGVPLLKFSQSARNYLGKD